MRTRSGGTAHTQRKKLGKYYTPDWVVDFIVEHTLGPTLQEQPDRLLGEFTVLDPACGDGAFLLGALRFLNNRVSSTDEKERRYTLRSLVDCIHGIDIDPKAVTSCRKRLSKTTSELLSTEDDFKQRVLLGNSLLQEDDDATAVFGKNLAKMHPVDWHRVYPWVMRDAGFDVIVGNPPYIGIKGMDAKIKNYIRRQYRTVHKQFDIIIPFLELGLNLLRPGGRLGFLISNKVLAADYGAPLRKHLVTRFKIEKMVDISQLDIFKDAAAYPHILILQKPKVPHKIGANETLVLTPSKETKNLSALLPFAIRVPQRLYAELPNTILTPVLTPGKFKIIQRLHRNTTLLGQICDIRCGIAKSGFTKQIQTKNQFEQLSKIEKRNTRPFLTAGDVDRYIIQKKKYMTYSPDFSSPEQWRDFGEPKLVIAGMGKNLRVSLDLEGNALGRVYYITEKRCPLNLFYLLAVLNSHLIDTYYTLLFSATHLRGGYIRYNASYLAQIPIIFPTPSQEAKIVKLAKQAHNDPTRLRRNLDDKIDKLIATLYTLTLNDVVRFSGHHS